MRIVVDSVKLVCVQILPPFFFCFVFFSCVICFFPLFPWVVQLRLYSRDGVREELEVAKALYIRAALTFNADEKVVLPKLLEW